MALIGNDCSPASKQNLAALSLHQRDGCHAFEHETDYSCVEAASEYSPARNEGSVVHRLYPETCRGIELANGVALAARCANRPPLPPRTQTRPVLVSQQTVSPLVSSEDVGQNLSVKNRELTP